ncbi:MAG TPA: IS110 family transposase [Sphaerochaeta sp.]|nr:IS110 family transposase [Sphaerochaeta sp.]
MDRPNELTASRIIGMDLSKKTLVGCILSNEDGFQKKTFFNGQMNTGGRTALASKMTEGDAVFMEGGSSSFTLARYLKNNTEADVFVLNPMQLHIIFESMCKTDKQDAAKLAKYGRDAHPENWCLIPIPTEQESAERSIMNLHISYSQFRTKIVNKLHAVFNGQGYPDLKKSDLKNSETRRLYASKLLDNESATYSAEILMDFLDFTELQIESIHKRITEICLAHPKEARSWLSIPGIGDITAATLIAYVGTGERFGTAAQLRNYVALIPRRDQSGNIDKQLGISKFGCMPIRRHIVQGAWGIKAFRRECSLTRYWKELQKRGKTGQKASVAISNKMLTIGFALLRSGGLYEMPDQEEYFRTKLISYKLEALIDCPTAKKDNDKSSAK